MKPSDIEAWNCK